MMMTTTSGVHVAIEASEVTFEGVYNAHVRQVLAYCLRRVSHAEAQDATAEVFAVAWRRFDDAPAGPDILPWLYGVAANVLRNQRRSARRARSLATKVGAQGRRVQPSPEFYVVRKVEHEVVQQAIESLGRKYREVIKLVEWEELPRDRVAEMLHVSRATIDQRMHRAYKQLRRILEVPTGERSERSTG